MTKAAAYNRFPRIIRLVEEAHAPTEWFIDRFVRWSMPAIVVIAALVILVPPLTMAQLWETWVYRGLALPLIWCPFALFISVPPSIS